MYKIKKIKKENEKRISEVELKKKRKENKLHYLYEQ